jgi:hypothetical protein
MTNRGDFNRASCVMDVTLRSNFVATPIYHESPTAPWCTFDNNTAHAFISKCEREKGFGVRERERETEVELSVLCHFGHYSTRCDCAQCVIHFGFYIIMRAIQWRGDAGEGRINPHDAQRAGAKNVLT